MEAGTATRSVKGDDAAEIPHDNLGLAFHATVEDKGDELAVKHGDRTLSWNELRSHAAAVAGGLASLGVEKGDTVALMLSNRLEFMPIDLGVITLGAVPFSIYQTASPEQIQYQCSDAGCRVAIVQEAHLEAFSKAKKDLPELEHLITLDTDDGTMTYESLLEKDPDFDDSVVEKVDADDLLTLIYTSGTTGPPKGVQLTHKNLMSLVAAVDDMIPFPDDQENRVISWLPTAHIAERGANYYLPVIKGIQVHVCEDPKKITEVLREVNPTWFFAVPRIWEKLKSGLETMLSNLDDEQRQKAQKGLEAAKKKVELEQAGEEVPDKLAEGVNQADENLFSGLRANLGFGEAVAVNVGAAPTPKEVLVFFHAIGIPIAELWGMSETCGVATCNPPEKVKIGTVGPPAPGVEIKLADDGEVFVRGDSIMAGYRNMEEKTAETIDEDGWLETGDIGDIDEDGYLSIVDRKKELIVNAAGKNMSPANIESEIKSATPLIGQAVAIGDDRPYNVALVVLDPDYAPDWAEKQGIEDNSLEALADNDQVREAIDEAIEEANQKMSRIEQIKKFTVLPQDWEPGGDELTPTMKLKRKPIKEKYEEEIAALYED